jgi:hypothetical protein
MEAMRSTLVAQAAGLSKRRRALVLYEKAMATSPTLRGGVQDRMAADIASIATVIAQRRGLDKPDDACTILATVSLVTYRHALMSWLHGPASANPVDIVADSFDILVKELSADGARPHRRAPVRRRAT